MFGPSLTSHAVVINRQTTDIDAEGTPVNHWAPIMEFRAGFGSIATGRELVAGHDGQRVDAAISTLALVDARIGDKAEVAGRIWKVVGVKATGYTTRILLAAWGDW